ncbi:hypothetical protein FGG08_006183 [Glutinoglossum americanum]|uniref:peptidylprolyl isomerase n=1 Tax=Glutinoglossum americanum TaxID=1670608 RepID=A0A9P8I218_9PEZI|nr:hypothetical protein FGG08_006183 [Glutinoglossum americanum]
MRFLSSLLLALASAMPFALASDTEELKIEVTRSVECTRKTKAGDTVEVHYRGTLASDGSEFDASYNRGTPLSFKLGAGRVIKGYGHICSLKSPTINEILLVFTTELMGIKGVSKDEL